MEGGLSAQPKGHGKDVSSGEGKATVTAEHAKLQRKFENIHSTYRSLKEAEAARREELAALAARLAEAEAGSVEELQAARAERDDLERRLSNVRDTHRASAQEETARREELASYQALLKEAEKERELCVADVKAEGEAKVEDLQRRLENVRETTRSVKDGERSQRGEVESLHKQLVDSRIERDESLAALKKESATEVARLNEQLEKVRATHSSAASEETAQRTAVDRMTESLAQAQQEHEQKLAELAEAANGQHAEAKREIETLKREHGVAAEAELKAREHAERLEVEAGALKVELKGLREKSAGDSPETKDDSGAKNIEKIASMMTRIEELVQEKREMATRMGRDAEALASLEVQVEEQRAASKEWAGTKRSQVESGEAAARELKAAKQKLEGLTRELGEVMAEAKAADERSAHGAKRMSELQAELEKERASLTESAREQVAQASAGEAAQGEFKALKAELGQKAKELKLATQELGGLSEELVGTKAEAKASAELSADDAARIKALEEKFEAQRESLSELARERAVQAVAGATVTDELHAASGELGSTKVQLEQKSVKLKAATRELNALGEAIAKASAGAEESEARAARDAKKIADIEKQLEEQRAFLEEFSEERAAAERSIAEKVAESKELESALMMQEKRWAGAETQISELEAQLALKAKLEEQLTKQTERLSSLSTEMSSSNENGAAAAAMIAQLEAELMTERSKAEALEEERSLQEQRSEQGVRAITLLERELDKKRELLTSLDAELTVLRETGATSFIGLSDPGAFTEAVSMRATLLA